MKSKNNIQKGIITITLLGMFFCVIYVPWQSIYQGRVEFLGYHVSWNKPAVYTDNDFLRQAYTPSGDSFLDSLPPNGLYDKQKEDKIRQQGYTIYPSWVKKFACIDYKRVILNCAAVSLIGAALYVISTIIWKNKL